MDRVDLLLKDQTAEALDRILGVGFFLDHQLELAPGDTARLVHAFGRPLHGADAAFACSAGDAGARRENADLQWLVLCDRRREDLRYRSRSYAGAGQLREGTTGVLHGIPPISTGASVVRICHIISM